MSHKNLDTFSKCGYTGPNYNDSIVDTAEPIYSYYLDDVLADSGDFSLDDTTLNFHIETGPNDDSTKLHVEIRAYSSESDLIDHVKTYDSDAQIAFDIVDHLSSYAETSGAIDSYEANGTVPDWYDEYECAYYDSAWGFRSGKTSDNIVPVTLLFKTTWGSGSTYPVIYTAPYLPGFNNKTSSFYPLSFVSFELMFDKWWYKKRLLVWRGTGWRVVPFAGPLSHLDNKASSWIKF